MSKSHISRLAAAIACFALASTLCACSMVSGTPQNKEGGSPDPDPSNSAESNVVVESGQAVGASADSASGRMAPAVSVVDAEMMSMALEQDPNASVFYSPYGAVSALGILANAAGEGSTAGIRIAGTMGYSDVKSLTEDLRFANSVAPMTADGKGFSSSGLVLYDKANAGNVEVDTAIAAGLASMLDTDVKEEDFAGNLAQAKEDVRIWASEKTNGFISDFESNAEEDTAADFLNAVYFKGDWLLPFEPDGTYEREFTASTGATSKVPMMGKTFEEPVVSYHDDGTFKGIRLDYNDNTEKVSMYMFLPSGANADRVSPGSAEAILDGVAKWNGMPVDYRTEFKTALDSGGDVYDELVLRMPTIEFRQKSDITQLLDRMGLGQALTGVKCALFGDRSHPIEIDQVQQDAKVRIDETGTTAAAITEMTSKVTSVNTKSDVKYFVCDVPYVFMIAGNENDVVYFTGAVNDVTPDMVAK